MYAIATMVPSSPVVPTSVGVAIVSAYLLHFLKTLKSLPRVTFYTTKLNTVLRAILSGLGALAISFSWAHVSGGGGVFTVTLPPFATFVGGLWHWGVQFGMQHLSEGVLQTLHQAADLAKGAVGNPKE